MMKGKEGVFEKRRTNPNNSLLWIEVIVLCLSNIMTNSYGGFWEVHPGIPFHSCLDCCDYETGMNKKTITQIMLFVFVFVIHSCDNEVEYCLIQVVFVVFVL